MVTCFITIIYVMFGHFLLVPTRQGLDFTDFTYHLKLCSFVKHGEHGQKKWNPEISDPVLFSNKIQKNTHSEKYFKCFYVTATVRHKDCMILFGL